MPSHERLERALAYADRWIAYRRWRLRVPGVQVAVRADGALVLDAAHGVADASTGEALTTAHRFRIASHSKSLAAIVAMRLVDGGRLRLDDRAADHVPALAATEAGALTVQELLSHGSGTTRDGDDVAHWHLERPFPDAEALVALAERGTARIPASAEFKYSNIGFGILGLVVEGVTGEPYARAFARLLAEPLGLEGTLADVDAAHAPAGAPLTAGHGALHSADERPVLASPGTGALAAATGALSSAAELTDALRTVGEADVRLLSAEGRRRMRQRLWTTQGRDGGSAGYGLGLMHREVDGRTWVGHGGAWTGQATRTLVDAERDVVVSVLTNAIDGPAEELAVGVARIVQAALDEPEPDADLAMLRSFEGTYAGIWGRLDVVELGGRLLGVSPTAADPLAAVDVLEPVDEDRVRIAAATGMGSGHELAVAERGPDGAVVRWRGAWHMESVPTVPDAAGAPSTIA
ncbi:serine hydrolase [Agrococcus sp. SL85]|uniref:serine hydrolase domain-containing protein n=1 Tax=Agrococcus sp. SL85 TaxID=2995141 RepID=UPI00226CFFDF|nr:serine hydrolase domain-containing protein [Agrococcus sp. SL85]WAC65874.1 serine hydrolase [Agrococcus sp. SL85]